MAQISTIFSLMNIAAEQRLKKQSFSINTKVLNVDLTRNTLIFCVHVLWLVILLVFLANVCVVDLARDL